MEEVRPTHLFLGARLEARSLRAACICIRDCLRCGKSPRRDGVVGWTPQGSYTQSLKFPTARILTQPASPYESASIELATFSPTSKTAHPCLPPSPIPISSITPAIIPPIATRSTYSASHKLPTTSNEFRASRSPGLSLGPIRTATTG